MRNENVVNALDKLDLSDEAKGRIFMKIKERCVSCYAPVRNRQAFSARILIAAAVAAALIATCGVAFGVYRNLLRHFSFDGGVASVVNYIPGDANPDFSYMGYQAGSWFEIEAVNRESAIDRDVFSKSMVVHITQECTGGIERAAGILFVSDRDSALREINQRMPITVSEPEYLPDGAEMSLISLLTTEDGETMAPHAYLAYSLPNNEMLSITMTYIGADADIQATFSHTFDIEPVTIGMINGLLVNYPINHAGEFLQVIFVSDGVCYEVSLQSPMQGIADRDALFAVAESVGQRERG